jgi:hypothetical protein
MLSQDELDAIRSRAEAGTGGYGEWKVEKYADDRRVDRFISTPNGAWVAQSVFPETATFIAHARTDVPELLATIAEVRSELVEHFDDVDIDYEGEPFDLESVVSRAAEELRSTRSHCNSETDRANVAEHKNSQLRSRFALELAARTTPDMAEMERQANRITELEESVRDERWMIETLAKALRVDLGAHCITELVHAAAGMIEKLKEVNAGLRKWQDLTRPKLEARIKELEEHIADVDVEDTP